ncbi:MAG: toxic anion resistance protein [Tannerella sp.]|jgi:uncharacterized protein YaaN involved in tellurite resistance|nr:toxic anion resistance protein [Tannerella sp.]
MENSIIKIENGTHLPENYPLTPEEKQAVENYKQKIDLSSPGSIIQYGSDIQQKIVSFSDSVLNNLRNKDIGEVGDVLSGLVAELKTFDKSLNTNRFIDYFRSLKKKIFYIKSQFSKVERNVEQVEVQMEKHYQTLSKDVILFDNLYAQNEQYFRDLSLYIRAGEEKLAGIKDAVPEDMAHRFDKKLHDLRISRMISLQLASQIRILQNNSATLMERIQSSLVNTLPLWRNQMILSLGLLHSQQAADAQHAVNEATNEMLRRNSEKLKTTSVKIAKENERSVVDLETLKKVNTDLFDTIQNVLSIQQEGRQKRQQAEQELLQIEKEIKSKMDFR